MRSSQKKRTILHFISSLKYGGAECMLADLITELPNFQHYVVYMHDGPIRTRLEAMGVTCIQLKGLTHFFDPVGWWRLYQYIQRIKPDVLHTALWAANLLGRCIGRLLGIKTISVIHAVRAHQGNLRTAIDAMTFWCSDEVVAVSAGVKQSFEAYRFIQRRSMKVIHNGINIERVYEEARGEQLSRSSLGYAQDDFIIGAVGRLVPVKNFELLIQSIAALSKEIPACKLLLIGQGPLEHTLRKLANERGIQDQVHFLLNVNARPYYVLFDCFVQPSWHEGLSMALLEALCFSVPAVVSGRNREHEVIEHHKEGMVVEPGSQEQLMEAIHELYRKPALRKGLGKEAFNKVKRQFGIQKMVEAYDKVF